jgi:hypothetical protein
MSQLAWAYETPLEPPEGFTLDNGVIEINGMKFQARSDCQYKLDYYAFMDRVIRCRSMKPSERKANPLENELNLYRNLFQSDLWAFVYFAMKNPLANHPFIVEACKEVESESGDTLNVWARDHLKTTIISVGRSVQKILNNPETRIGIFSATRPLALKIQLNIKELLESEILVKCFPDILYENPGRDAQSWSNAPEGGLIVKRNGIYREPTVSSWGLVEGQPTGYHFTDMIYDDIVTIDTTSPEVMQRVCDNFDMSENLSSRDCQRTVIGTYYRHDDPLVYIRDKLDPETGLPMFRLIRKPATVDGTMHGKAVFSPERVLKKKRAGKLYFFYCQQLLDPTPRGFQKLNREHLIVCSRKDLPLNLYKFMLIDGSGDEGRRQDRAADDWALGVIGVEPYRDDTGASRIYILDLIIESMDLATAQQTAVEMYMRNGRILKLGIEKVGMSTTEIHICSALRAKGRYLSVKQGNLQILKPSGRSKQYRIESGLTLPFTNSKIRILDSIEGRFIERLRLEMEKFPSWNKDDGLDMLSYIYDVIKEYRFGAYPTERPKESAYDYAFRRARHKKHSGWISV